MHNAIYWADDTVAPVWVGGQQVALEQTGKWVLNKIPLRGATRFTPSAINPGVSEADPREDGILNSDTDVARVSKVALTGTKALDFPGWNDDPVGQEDDDVDDDDSSARIPHRAKFNPANRSEFGVSVYVRPDNSVIAPDKQLTDLASPNIVQKGLTTDPNGFWKVSMLKDMSVVCTFKGLVQGSLASRSFSSTDTFEMTPGTNYRIECGWTPTLLSLTIKEVKHGLGREDIVFGGSNPSSQPMSGINNTASVWVGKKPNSREADDAFAGAIDEFTILRSAA